MFEQLCLRVRIRVAPGTFRFIFTVQTLLSNVGLVGAWLGMYFRLKSRSEFIALKRQEQGRQHDFVGAAALFHGTNELAQKSALLDYKSRC